MGTKIDLHTHTTASDGIYSPKNLIDLAVRDGITTLAITDHDTVDGLPEALAYAARIGYPLIPGIEFSIDHHGGSFHLVGLFIDHENRELRDTIVRLGRLRDERGFRIIENLREHGIDVPLEEVLREAAGGSLGRPHIARVMVRMGLAGDIKEIFKNYMVKGKPGFVKKQKISLPEAVDLIRKSGGIAVIAHPVSLNFESFDDFEKKIPGFIRTGIEGLEAYASMHTPAEVEKFLEIARKYSLLVSGGSDFHGDKNEVMGCYAEGEAIPAELLDELIRHRNRRTGITPE